MIVPEKGIPLALLKQMRERATNAPKSFEDMIALRRGPTSDEGRWKSKVSRAPSRDKV
jgi:hypothetical protein